MLITILDGQFFMRLLRTAFLRAIRCAQCHCDTCANHGCPGSDGRDVRGGRGQRRVETARIPEVRFRTAETAVPRLDREAGAAVPFGRGAGVVRGRSLAAQFKQAPAVARAFIVESFCKLALIVERAAIAAVVDGLAVEGLGTAQIVQFGQLAESEVMREHAGDHHRESAGSRRC